MGIKRMLTGKWFTRLVLISWIICTGSIFVVFKNMELIVHGQLYDYGLIFSTEWADAYRIFTWLIFVCLGLPMALSGIALASSCLKVERVPKREKIVPKKVGPPRGVAKVESRPIVKNTPSKVDSGNSIGIGISCPECKKVFGRALVMLDFRSGKNRMVSVCPYCNHILGFSSDEDEAKNSSFTVETPDKKVLHY